MAGTHHAVRVTRRELAEWFDEYYEDGEPGIGKFSWLSDHGATCFECLRNKNLIFLRQDERVWLLGPGIKEIANGDVVTVDFFGESGWGG